MARTKKTFEEALDQMGEEINKQADAEIKFKHPDPLKHATKLLHNIEKLLKQCKKLKKQYGDKEQIKTIASTLSKYQKDISEHKAMLEQIDILENHLFFLILDKKSVIGIYKYKLLAWWRYLNGIAVFYLLDLFNGSRTDYHLCKGTKEASNCLGVSERIFLEHFAKEIKRLQKQDSK